MDIRSQVAMVFHLDKCIGCHTCSIACKNIWTDRKGAEYQWWNNVETKPGTGFPTKWENQETYQGGWQMKKGKLALKSEGRGKTLANLFHSPYMPVIDDYYEPWTYTYNTLIDAEQGTVQPVAQPVSLITGEKIKIKSGPNWDDDLGGTPDYARKDVNMKALSDAEQEAMFQLERMVMFYLPRMCNHCLNPSCVASCPSGAIYKRGEDGVVLINQKKCRGWRKCVTSCPYKKTFYNWQTGKSEKCILCYPRLETGQVPACMHTCVGRIRYLGAMLYDADKIKDIASADEKDLVDSQLDIYLDPFDPEVIKEAKANGIPDSTIEAAQKSPVYKFVKKWKVAFPLHPEFRTVPNLFYVPPLLPAMGTKKEDNYESISEELWSDAQNTRIPIKYLASLFTAGNTEKVVEVLRKLMAVRIHRRDVTVGDVNKDMVKATLENTSLDTEMADEIFRLTSLARHAERFVIPPMHREEAEEMIKNTADTKGDKGFGFIESAHRGL